MPIVLQPLGQQRQVSLDHGADVAVDDRGAGALVLLHLGQQVGGEGQDNDLGRALPDRLGHELFMGRVGVGVEQADGHRLDAAVRDGLRGPVHRPGIEGAAAPRRES